MKTTVKRKSDSALLVQKRRKISISSGDASISDVERETSEGLFIEQEPPARAVKYIKKTAPRTRKSEPVRKARMDEYDEDVGRMESQTFLALVEMESKKKKKAAKANSEFMGKFHQNVEDEEQALKKQLKGLGIQSAENDMNFLISFKEAYTMSRPAAPSNKNDQDQSSSSTNEMSFASLYQHSKKLTSQAYQLIDDFEKADEKTTNIDTSGLINNDWQDQNGEVSKLLKFGMNVGLAKIEALLTGAKEPAVEEGEETNAQNWYREEDGATFGWGRMAKKQGKAMKKVVQAGKMSAVA